MDKTLPGEMIVQEGKWAKKGMKVSTAHVYVQDKPYLKKIKGHINDSSGMGMQQLLIYTHERDLEKEENGAR